VVLRHPRAIKSVAKGKKPREKKHPNQTAKEKGKSRKVLGKSPQIVGREKVRSEKAEKRVRRVVRKKDNTQNFGETMGKS